uniref:Uncharacterized protein n=1 Tax=Anopheles stephensi TaxID=30069 RepID=A0A182YM76_ANOST
METEKPGQAMCPYDPTHNSTAVFVDNELYSGTVADFSGLDPIIYREHLQTEQYDSLSLNAPNFVGSFTQGDFVYFFFRETAVEFINCGKEISDTFEGNFKEQSGLNSNWLPVNPLNVPDPRPGSCHNDSRTLPDLTLNFKKTHSLMDETVPAFFGSPILTRVSTMYRFTAIAVDPQIKTPGGKTYDVIFVGTDHGKILKTVNAESADSNKKVTSVVIEEIDALQTNEPIRTLEIVRTTQYDLEYDPQRPFRDQPADKIQFNSENYNDKGPQITPDLINAQYTVETLVMAVLAGAIFALLVGFITGYFCGRRCHKDEDDNLPYPDTEYEYFEQRQNVNRIQAEPKLLPQVEEVTYAEPVLLPQPSSQNKMQHSPKNTLRKPMGHHHGVNSETLFQFQPDNYNNARDNYRGRDNFGTLRSHQQQQQQQQQHQQQQQQQQLQHHSAATTSKSYPALVVLDSDAAAGGDGGILYPSGNSNFGHAVPHGTTSQQHNYTLCYPHYPPPSPSAGAPGYTGSSAPNPATVMVPRSASPLASSSRTHTHTVLLNSTNSSGNDTTKKLNRLSTSSSLSIITPPTTPKRPGGSHRTAAAGSGSGSTGRLKMALSASLAHNFNQKLANLNDKWNDFSFLLLQKAGGGASTGNATGGASGRTNARNDSYHSIESAVTCTAADFEAGNFYHRESESESNHEFRTTHQQQQQQQQQQREPSGGRSMAGPSASRSRDQRQRKPRLRTSRRNSASGDPKEFDMLVLKPIDTADDDNESF